MSHKAKRNRYEEINSIRWYYYLVPNEDCIALLDVLDSPEEKFIVCATLPTDNPKRPLHLFAAFGSSLDFINHIKMIPQDKWYFFEIILGSNPQKLYFDIDLKKPEVEGNMDEFTQLLLEDLIERVLKIFVEHGHQLDLRKNILLFSSNSDEKRSYHLIVDGFNVSNNLENRALAEEILDGMSLGYRDHIDPGVYSSKQQFRMYLSQKPHSGRPKIFLDKWPYRGTMIHSTLTEVPAQISDEMKAAILLTRVFLASTITYVKGSTPISVLFEVTELKPTRVRPEFEESVEITDEMAKEIFEKADPVILQIYKKKGMMGPFILLSRRTPAHCSLCRTKEREADPHTSENAFLRVTESGRVYFHCRRNANQSRYLMTISVQADVDLQRAHVQSVFRMLGTLPTIHTSHSLMRAIGAGKM